MYICAIYVCVYCICVCMATGSQWMERDLFPIQAINTLSITDGCIQCGQFRLNLYFTLLSFSCFIRRISVSLFIMALFQLFHAWHPPPRRIKHTLVCGFFKWWSMRQFIVKHTYWVEGVEYIANGGSTHISSQGVIMHVNKAFIYAGYVCAYVCMYMGVMCIYIYIYIYIYVGGLIYQWVSTIKYPWVWTITIPVPALIWP